MWLYSVSRQISAPHTSFLIFPPQRGSSDYRMMVFDVGTAEDIDHAFQKMQEQHFQAVLAFSASLFSSERKRIAALGLRHHLAVMGSSRYFVEAGSLLSYGVDFPTLWYDTATFVDKILRGEK